MKVRLRLFALLRDRAGVDQAELELAEGATVASAIGAAGRQFPAIIALLPRVAAAVNLHYVETSHVLNNGDELALIPPVSGGA